MQGMGPANELRAFCISTLAQMEDIASTANLTAAQWFALRLLVERDGRAIGELADHLRMDSGATTRVVDGLESKSLARRIRFVVDRRQINIHVTEDGKAVVDKLENELRALVQRINTPGRPAEV